MTSTRVNNSPGCLIQILWFAFVGWWLGQIWIVAAYILILIIVGIPLGVSMINRLPQIIALRAPNKDLSLSEDGFLREERVPQRPFILRAIYFVLIGWWLTALWVEVAYLLTVSIIGLPFAFWMFDRTPAVLSLQRR
jgi:uncharacterized membrane protein YccF (DUF307 family)